VDEPDVDVGGTELRQGRVEVGFTELWAMRVVPQLGDYGDILAGDTGFGDTIGDLEIRTNSPVRPAFLVRLTSFWFPYIKAQSRCLYPTLRASSTLTSASNKRGDI
jgi:hypothetical protein